MATTIPINSATTYQAPVQGASAVTIQCINTNGLLAYTVQRSVDGKTWEEVGSEDHATGATHTPAEGQSSVYPTAGFNFVRLDVSAGTGIVYVVPSPGAYVVAVLVSLPVGRLVVLPKASGTLTVSKTDSRGQTLTKGLGIAVTSGTAYDAADLGLADAVGAVLYTPVELYIDFSGDKSSDPGGELRIPANSTFSVGAANV